MSVYGTSGCWGLMGVEASRTLPLRSFPIRLRHVLWPLLTSSQQILRVTSPDPLPGRATPPRRPAQANTSRGDDVALIIWNLNLIGARSIQTRTRFGYGVHCFSYYLSIFNLCSLEDPASQPPEEPRLGYMRPGFSLPRNAGQ